MQNKVVLITGSSHGIGAETAKYFADNRYDVIVTYKSAKTEADTICSYIRDKGRKALSLHLDVVSEESVQDTMKSIEQEFGKLDVLVNNAGIDWDTPIETCTFEDWKAITRTKIDGNFLCTKYALPLLKKAGNANIIVIMSSLGENSDPMDPAYSVATAGTISFMKAMALALAKYNIRTNGIGPGQTKTNLKYWKVQPEEIWDKMAKENPMGRNTNAADVAKTILAIVEDKSNYLNGNIIYVNGGGHLK